MKKRILSILLILAFVITAIGCGKKEESKKNNDAPATQEVTKEEEPTVNPVEDQTEDETDTLGVTASEEYPTEFDTKITIAINPQITLMLADGFVFFVGYDNEDAVDCYGDLVLEGLTLEEATTLIMNAAIDKEYFKDGGKVDVHVENGKTIELSEEEEAIYGVSSFVMLYAGEIIADKGLDGEITTTVSLNTPEGINTTTETKTVEEIKLDAAEVVEDTPVEDPVVDTPVEDVPAVEEEPKTEEKPAYTVEAYEATMYIQKDVSTRKGPSKDYKKVKTLKKGTEIKITGKASTGWYQLEDGSFITNSKTYVGANPPKEEVKVETPKTETKVETPKEETKTETSSNKDVCDGLKHCSAWNGKWTELRGGNAYGDTWITHSSNGVDGDESNAWLIDWYNAGTETGPSLTNPYDHVTYEINTWRMFTPPEWRCSHCGGWFKEKSFNPFTEDFANIISYDTYYFKTGSDGYWTYTPEGDLDTWIDGTWKVTVTHH